MSCKALLFWAESSSQRFSSTIKLFLRDLCGFAVNIKINQEKERKIMSDDIAFKIQLGFILAKLKEKVSNDMSEIIEELAGIVKAGSLEDDKVPMDAVKEIIMKDLEIFLDDSILPEIEKKKNQPEEKAEEAEEETEEAESGEAKEEEKE